MSRSDFESEVEERRSKKAIRGPCVYTAWNEVKHRDTEFYPAVSCDCECDKCGWNPAVAAVRIARLKERLQMGGDK